MDLAARAHVLSAEDVAAALGVRLSRGLSPAEVERRRAVHGWNELPAERAMPFYRLMLSQFDDGLVKILLAAAAVSFGLALSESDKSARAMAEPAVIVLILLLNALVGAVQERSAAKAIDALKEYEPDDATVLRCGGEGGSAPELRTVRARELVPGDVVRLSVGDQVPADLRLAKLLSTALRMQQALLTGETAANHKEEAALDEADAGIELQAKRCLLFCGTTVAYGSALGLVVATGGATQMGQIGAQVATTDSGPSPLKQRLDEFGGLLSRLIGAICVCVWLVNIPSFADPAFGGWLNGAVYYFKIAIALAVAAIPEGLPAVVTTCLALGTRRMARRHAIARSLPSVETLGTTSVVCSDKTVRAPRMPGSRPRPLALSAPPACALNPAPPHPHPQGTLTTSHMSARALLTFEQPRAGGAGECAPRYYVVDGTGYNPEQGRIHAPRAAPPAHERGGGVLGGRGVSWCAGLRTASPAGAGELASDAELCADAALQALAAGCALCNHSHIHCPEDDEAEAGADGESAAAAANGGERAPRLYRCVGEPTEAALRVLAEKVGIGSGGSAGLHSVPPKAPGGEGAPEDACMPAQLSSGASASGAEPHTARWQRLWRPRAFLEFTRDRRSMSVLCERGGGAEADAAAAADPLGCGRWRLFVKGAAENVLERCTHCLLGSGALVPLELSTRAQVEGALAALCGGTEALRTLAVAARTSFGKEGPPSAEALADVGAMAAVESGLVLLGFVGIADPVRPEVAPAIRLCRRAGIRVIVVTGDNVHTGLSVCRQAGIITAEDEHEHARARAEEAEEEARDGGGGRDAHSGASPVVARACVPPRRRYLALTGRELCALPEAEQLEAAAQCALFARTEPAHKLRLVALLQTLGEVVAMTGDGVNDAPALKKADIGVAMGSGTAVAKGAADMILADDNFATIVGAVEEGRTIYANTKAFIRYLVSSNVGEVVAIVLTALLGMPGALAPVQLLWVNLVTGTRAGVQARARRVVP